MKRNLCTKFNVKSAAWSGRLLSAGLLLLGTSKPFFCWTVKPVFITSANVTQIKWTVASRRGGRSDRRQSTDGRLDTLAETLTQWGNSTGPIQRAVTGRPRFNSRLRKWLAVICLSGQMGCTNKKLSYRRRTARCVVSLEILPVATQQCRN